MNDRFAGTGVALITPFKENLTPDMDALERLVEHVISGGVDYLVIMGTTGESATLDPDEKREVLRGVRDINRGRLPLVAGIGGNNTKAVCEALQGTDLEGYEAILSVSPYYNRPTQEGIFQHFKALARVSPLPLILYNVPGRTGSNILPDTVLRLASESGKILGIKEASGDMGQITDLIRRAPEGFLVISGDDINAAETVLKGGVGVISVLGQGVPGVFTEMIREAMSGNTKGAMEIHHRLEPLMELIFREGNPAGIKGVLAHLGICLPGVRLPLVPSSEALMTELGTYLDDSLQTVS